MPVARVIWTRIAAGCAAGALAVAAALAPALPAAADAADDAPLLAQGARGEAVRIVQEALGIPATGRFDKATVAAVIAFQQRVGIDPALGTVGPRTWAALGPRPSRTAARTMPPEPVGGKVCPTRDFTYADGFGASRWHGSHMGMDMMGREGTPLYAIEDGVVVRAGVQSNGALRIVFQGESGSKYYYGHNSKHFVSSGDRVSAGDVIGLMGDTGSPGAVHLHFEYWRSGGESAAVDPEPLLRRICTD